MVRPVLFWKQRIVEFMTARSRYLTYSTQKETEIEKNFTSHIDENFYVALKELIDNGIIHERNMGNMIGHTIDVLKKKDEIKYLLRLDENDTKAELIVPTDEEFGDYKLVFNNASERKYPNQGIYYYTTSKKNPSSWLVLIKHNPIKKAMRVKLGSLDDDESFISRIWKSTKLASQLSQDSKFVRKNVEDLDQQACGNNRIRSKCAFDIFVYLGKLEICGQKGLSKIYNLKQITSISKDPDDEKN